MPQEITCPRCSFIFNQVDAASSAPSVEAQALANANKVLESLQSSQLEMSKRAEADKLAIADLQFHLAEVQSKLEAATPQPEAEPVEVLPHPVALPPVHVTDADVVGETGDVVEVKGNDAPAWPTGAQFDLP